MKKVYKNKACGDVELSIDDDRRWTTVMLAQDRPEDDWKDAVALTRRNAVAVAKAILKQYEPEALR